MMTGASAARCGERLRRCEKRGRVVGAPQPRDGWPPCGPKPSGCGARAPLGPHCDGFFHTYVAIPHRCVEGKTLSHPRVGNRVGKAQRTQRTDRVYAQAPPHASRRAESCPCEVGCACNYIPPCNDNCAENQNPGTISLHLTAVGGATASPKPGGIGNLPPCTDPCGLDSAADQRRSCSLQTATRRARTTACDSEACWGKGGGDDCRIP